MTDRVSDVPRFHFLHRWEPWGTAEQWSGTRLPVLGEESLVVPFGSDGLVHFTKTIQRRYCVVCNALQVRTI